MKAFISITFLGLAWSHSLLASPLFCQNGTQAVVSDGFYTTEEGITCESKTLGCISNQCPQEDQIQCPEGSRVMSKVLGFQTFTGFQGQQIQCARQISACVNVNNCPQLSPIKCPNGSSLKVNIKGFYESVTGGQCPDYEMACVSNSGCVEM